MKKGASIKKPTLGLALSFILCSAALTQAAYVHYNSTTDFVTYANPNGVWSYGTLSGSVPFTADGIVEGWDTARGTPEGLCAWELTTGRFDPSVTYNYLTDPVSAFGYTWPGNAVALDCWLGNESTTGWPCIRFTAPDDGVYDISGFYQDLTDGGGGGGGTDVWLNNSITGWTHIGVATSGTYSFTDISLVAGQSLSIVTAGAGTVTQLDMTVDGNTYSYNQWTGNLTGNWTAPANWTLSPVPNAAGAMAEFGNTISDSATVTVNAPVTVGMLKLNNSNFGYTIEGSSAITLDNTGGTGNAKIVVLGHHAISAPMALNGTAEVTYSAVSDSLTLSGSIADGTTPGALTYVGKGTGDTQTPNYSTLTINGANTFTGPVVMAAYARLAVNNIGPTTTPNSLGQSGPDAANLVINGQLTYTGTAAAPTMVTTDRGFTLAGAGVLDGIEVQNPNINLKFTGQIATVAAANAFRKTGAGTLTFANADVNTLAHGDFQVEEGAMVFENGTFNKERVNIIFQEGWGDFFVADTAGKSASLLIQNGAVVNNKGALTVGLKGGTGSLTLTDNSQATMTAEAKFGVEGGSATLTLSGTNSTQFSKLTLGDAAWFGVDTGGGPAHAVVNMSGYAELHIAAVTSGNTHIGWGIGSTATIHVTDNSKLSMEGTNNPTFDPVAAIVDIADGGAIAEVVLDKSSSMTVPNGLIFIGGNILNAATNGAQGTLTLKDSATLTAGRVVIVGDSGTNGTLNLNGGVSTVPAFVKGATSLSSTINFNGGILKAAAGELLYIDSAVPATATGLTDFIQGTGFAVNVLEGGAKFDTNALDVTVTQVLAHAGTAAKDGGLTKLGDGSLTLTALPTYTGNTTVNQGTLNADAGISTPNATVYVATGATLNAPSIVADTLSIGGTPLAAAVPEPGTLALLILAVLGLAFAASRKR